MTHRSTKGASRVRREAMGEELAMMRKLMPVKASEKRHLSQIQLLSIVTAYITKSNRLKPLVTEDKEDSQEILQKCSFEQALHGFILAITSEGRLLYISENVAEYLGYTMMDLMTHNESVYDITDERDHTMMRLTLEGEATDYIIVNWRFVVARRFRRQVGCHRYKELRVRGRFVSVDSSSCPLFLATCTPSINSSSSGSPSSSATVSSAFGRISSMSASLQAYNTMAFTSVHSLDMKFIDIDDNGLSHYGYTRDDMVGKSWYELIHPDDIETATTKHLKMVPMPTAGKEMPAISCSLYIRLQTKYGHYITIRMDLRHRRTGRHRSRSSRQQGPPTDVVIHATNHVLEQGERRVVVDDVNDMEHRSATKASVRRTAAENVGKRKLSDDEEVTENTEFAAAKKMHCDDLWETGFESDTTTAATTEGILNISAALPTAVSPLPSLSRSTAVDGQLVDKFPVLARMVQNPSVVAVLRCTEQSKSPSLVAETSTPPLVIEKSRRFNERTTTTTLAAVIPDCLPDCLLTPEQSPLHSFDFEYSPKSESGFSHEESVSVSNRNYSSGQLLQVVPDSSVVDMGGYRVCEPSSGYIMPATNEKPVATSELVPSVDSLLPDLDLGILDRVLGDLDETTMSQLIGELASTVEICPASATAPSDPVVTTTCIGNNNDGGGRLVLNSNGQDSSIESVCSEELDSNNISSSSSSEVFECQFQASNEVEDRPRADAVKLPDLLLLCQSVLKSTITQLFRQQLLTPPSHSLQPRQLVTSLQQQSRDSVLAVKSAAAAAATCGRQSVDDPLLQYLLLSTDLITSLFDESLPSLDTVTSW